MRLLLLIESRRLFEIDAWFLPKYIPVPESRTLIISYQNFVGEIAIKNALLFLHGVFASLSISFIRFVYDSFNFDFNYKNHYKNLVLSVNSILFAPFHFVHNFVECKMTTFDVHQSLRPVPHLRHCHHLYCSCSCRDLRYQFLQHRPTMDYKCKIINENFFFVQILYIIIITYYCTGQSVHVSMYRVSVMFDSCVLNGNAHLLEMLHGFCTFDCFFRQFHGSYWLSAFNGFGSVIHCKACVVVKNQTSGLQRNREK